MSRARKPKRRSSKVEKARQLGAAAFHAGKPRNATPDVIRLLEPGAPMGDSIPLFDAWTEAWDRENLAAPIPNPREGKYRIQGYDAEYSVRDRVTSASSGHRIQQSVKTKGEVLKLAKAWMEAHPPKPSFTWRSGGASTHSKAYLEISEHGYRVALWDGESGQWVEQINHLKPARRTPKAKKNPKKTKRSSSVRSLVAKAMK